MIFLLQVYRRVTDKDLFIKIFSDLEFELEEMGWKDDPDTLMNDILFNHFGFFIQDDWQLSEFTRIVLNKKDLNFLKALP